MSYARNLLSRGEEVVFESRQHWFAVLGRDMALRDRRDPGLRGADLGHDQRPGQHRRRACRSCRWWLLIVSLACIGLKVWSWRNQEYLITTRRVIKAEGIFNKQMGDSSLEKVNDARLTQSWVGRIFDYGTLDILTAVRDGRDRHVNDFPMLAEPVKFKVAMLNQKEKLELPDLAPAAASSTQPRARHAASRADGAARWLRPGRPRCGRWRRRLPAPTGARGSRRRCGGRRRTS